MTENLDQLRAEVVEHGLLDYDQAQELLDRAEAAEQALDFHTQRDRELKTLLSTLSDRLDEFSYEELASLIEDEPLNQWSEKYTSKLQAAEAELERIRPLFENYSREYPIECNKRVAAEVAVQRVEALLTDAENVEAVIRSRYDRIWIDSVRRALDGGEQE